MKKIIKSILVVVVLGLIAKNAYASDLSIQDFTPDQLSSYRRYVQDLKNDYNYGKYENSHQQNEQQLFNMVKEYVERGKRAGRPTASRYIRWSSQDLAKEIMMRLENLKTDSIVLQELKSLLAELIRLKSMARNLPSYYRDPVDKERIRYLENRIEALEQQLLPEVYNY